MRIVAHHPVAQPSSAPLSTPGLVDETHPGSRLWSSLVLVGFIAACGAEFDPGTDGGTAGGRTGKDGGTGGGSGAAGGSQDGGAGLTGGGTGGSTGTGGGGSTGTGGGGSTGAGGGGSTGAGGGGSTGAGGGGSTGAGGGGSAGAGGGGSAGTGGGGSTGTGGGGSTGAGGGGSTGTGGGGSTGTGGGGSTGALPRGYVFCANETLRCGFVGTGMVAYGADDCFVFQQATDGVLCDNATLGDPIKGRLKACYLQAEPSGGHMTYRLERSATPTAEEQAAYARITAAMDAAVALYNQYTAFEKTLTVHYDPSVQTADASISGNIRFGPNAGYQSRITATHEVAHTVGVGQSGGWFSLVVDGVYRGEKATRLLRAISGNPSDTLKGDRIHFWPYGLNYASEVSSDTDLVNHCKLVDAMRLDGL